LKQLLGDHPLWLLSEAIAHLEGQDDVKIEPSSSCSPPPIHFDMPNGCDMISSSSCSTTFSPFDFMGQPSSVPSTISLESLTSPGMTDPDGELTSKGVSPALLKRELSQSCTPEFDYPYFLSDPPQWPFRPNAPPAAQVQPTFFNPESQFMISVCPPTLIVADCRCGLCFGKQPTVISEDHYGDVQLLWMGYLYIF
jgi:hypothetical protein